MAGGVYPRVGGGTLLRGAPETAAGGLSPRGRGNPGISFSLLLAGRSIPAWAGEPLLSVCWLFHVQVYPRVGGGTGCKPRLARILRGLSPRGRGNRFPTPAPGPTIGSIPAWAGEPCS